MHSSSHDGISLRRTNTSTKNNQKRSTRKKKSEIIRDPLRPQGFKGIEPSRRGAAQGGEPTSWSCFSLSISLFWECGKMGLKIPGKSLPELLIMGRRPWDFSCSMVWGAQDSSKNTRVGMESNFLPVFPLRHLQNSEAVQDRSLRAESLEGQRSDVAASASWGNKTWVQEPREGRNSSEHSRL